MTLEGEGRHLELPLRCHLLQAAFPDSPSPRGESEGSRGGSRKRAETQDGPSSSRFQLPHLSSTPDRPPPLPHLHCPSPAPAPAPHGPSPRGLAPSACGVQRLSQASCSSGWEGGRRARPNYGGLGGGRRKVRRAESVTVGSSLRVVVAVKTVTMAAVSPGAERAQIQGQEGLPGPQSILAHCQGAD